jgi:hypothetical protein
VRVRLDTVRNLKLSHILHDGLHCSSFTCGCGGMFPKDQWCARTPFFAAKKNAASAWCPRL